MILKKKLQARPIPQYFADTLPPHPWGTYTQNSKRAPRLTYLDGVSPGAVSPSNLARFGLAQVDFDSEAVRRECSSKTDGGTETLSAATSGELAAERSTVGVSLFALHSTAVLLPASTRSSSTADGNGAALDSARNAGAAGVGAAASGGDFVPPPLCSPARVVVTSSDLVGTRVRRVSLT